ncbi:MAG: response regulator transcription factor [Spirochaetota bacterium]
MYNIVIIDDHSVVLEGISSILHNSKSINILGKFRDPRVALSFIRGNSNKIDIVVTDLDLPEMNGLDLIKKTKAIDSHIKVILFTFIGEKKYVLQSKKLNVESYVLKSESISVLPRIITSVLGGKMYYSPAVKIFLQEKEDTLELSQIQKNILHLLIKGKTAIEIANHCGRSKKTIEYHTAQMRKQWKAKNNVELIHILQEKDVVL